MCAILYQSSKIVNKMNAIEFSVGTGIKHDSTIDEALANAGIRITHYFSIVEHLEGNDETIEWRDGLPYADEDKWNSAKSEYCEKVGIDFMFDDSPIYLETFRDIDTTYLHVINQERRIFEVRR
jgi:hypothetical protein